jgi:hypothetical protein
MLGDRRDNNQSQEQAADEGQAEPPAEDDEFPF